MTPAAPWPPAGDSHGIATARLSPDPIGVIPRAPVPADGRSSPARTESRFSGSSGAPSSWKNVFSDDETAFSTSSSAQTLLESQGSTRSDAASSSPGTDLPMPAMTSSEPSISTSAVGLEVPRPYLSHRSSKVRFSSPLRQELKDEPSGNPQGTTSDAEFGLASPPKRTTSLVHRNLSTEKPTAGTGKVAWAKSVRESFQSTGAGPSTGRGDHDSSSMSHPSVRRSRTAGHMMWPLGDGQHRGLGQRVAGPRRQPSIKRKPVPGLWGEVADGSATPPRSPSTFGERPHPTPASLKDRGGLDFSENAEAPRFSRSGLKRGGVVLPTPKAPRPATVAISNDIHSGRRQDMPRAAAIGNRSATPEPARVQRSPSTRFTGLVRRLSKRRREPAVLDSPITSDRPVVISSPVLNNITHMDVPGQPTYRMSLQRTGRGVVLRPVAPTSVPKALAPHLFDTPSPSTSPSPSMTPRLSTTTALTNPEAPGIPSQTELSLNDEHPLPYGPEIEPQSWSMPRQQPTSQLPVPVLTPLNAGPIQSLPAIDSERSNNLRAGHVPVHTVPTPQLALPGQRTNRDSQASAVSSLSHQVSIHDTNEFGALVSAPTALSSLPFWHSEPATARADANMAGRWSGGPIAPEPDSAAGQAPQLPSRGSSLNAHSAPSSPQLSSNIDLSVTHPGDVFASRSQWSPTQTQFSQSPLSSSISLNSPTTPYFPSNLNSRPLSTLSSRRSLASSVPAMLVLNEVDEPLQGPDSAPVPQRVGAPLPPGAAEPDLIHARYPQVLTTVNGTRRSSSRGSWQMPRSRGHQSSASDGSLYDCTTVYGRMQGNLSSRPDSQASLHTRHDSAPSEPRFSTPNSPSSASPASVRTAPTSGMCTPDRLLADIRSAAPSDLPTPTSQRAPWPRTSDFSLHPSYGVPPTDPLPDLPLPGTAGQSTVAHHEVDEPDRGARSSGDESTPALSNDHSQSVDGERTLESLPQTPLFCSTPLLERPQKEFLSEASLSPWPFAVPRNDVPGAEPVKEKSSRSPVIGYSPTAPPLRQTTQPLELPVRRKVTIVRNSGPKKKISLFSLSTPLVVGDRSSIITVASAAETERDTPDDDTWSVSSLTSASTDDAHDMDIPFTLSTPPFRKGHLPHSSIASSDVFSLDGLSIVGQDAAVVETVTRAKTAMALELRL